MAVEMELDGVLEALLIQTSIEDPSKLIFSRFYTSKWSHLEPQKDFKMLQNSARNGAGWGLGGSVDSDVH